MIKRFIVALTILVFLASIFTVNVRAGTSEFRIGGGWPLPPGYHGNPFGPGGVGAAYWFMYEPLFYYLPGNDTFIPRLGISYEVTDDGKTLIVHLREGVLWHDEKPFTSEDVKTTWYIIGALYGVTWWRYIESIETPDPHTVIFKLNTASPLVRLRILVEALRAPKHIFGHLMSNAEEILKIRKEMWSYEARGEKVPEELSEKLGKALADFREKVYAIKPGVPTVPGTGPYMVTRVTESEITLKKFEKHYKAATTLVDTVRIFRWANNEVMWGYLLGGEIDAGHPASPPDVNRAILERWKGKMGFALPSDYSIFALLFNLEDSLMKDPALRRAIAHVIDKKKVREVCYYFGLNYEKYAPIVLRSIYNKWLPEDVLAKFTSYEHDLKKAEEILLAAGYTKGEDGLWRTPEGKVIEIEVQTNAPYSDWVLAADEIARELAAFGFKAVARPIPSEIFWPGLDARNYRVAFAWGPAAWPGHPLEGAYRLFTVGGELQRRTGFDPLKTYDTPWGPAVPAKLVDELLTTTDPERQKEIVQILSYIANEELPLVPIVEKRIGIYYLDGVRVTGWPSEDDPAWTLTPGGIERFYVLLLSEGILKPVAG